MNRKKILIQAHIKACQAKDEAKRKHVEDLIRKVWFKSPIIKS